MLLGHSAGRGWPDGGSGGPWGPHGVHAAVSLRHGHTAQGPRMADIHQGLSPTLQEQVRQTLAFLCHLVSSVFWGPVNLINARHSAKSDSVVPHSWLKWGSSEETVNCWVKRLEQVDLEELVRWSDHCDITLFCVEKGVKLSILNYWDVPVIEVIRCICCCVADLFGSQLRSSSFWWQPSAAVRTNLLCSLYNYSSQCFL